MDLDAAVKSVGIVVAMVLSGADALSVIADALGSGCAADFVAADEA
ncbi:hypothetical protein [Glycomyces rhizosphaerae]|uniref:Uncharacterized protein n=1 Tax=Glycomyces rhizosphaerae TaxID=2054422 RepID=A0ABV7PTK8_9ACTN